MKQKHKIAALAAFGLALVLAAVWYFHRHPVAVLSPGGPIGHQERNLIFVGLLLAVIVVVPVYTMAIVIARKYRAENISAVYRPDWDGNRLIEFSWWAIPGVIILILSIITWNSAHNLDPFKPLNSAQPPLTIQVVSLDWKWLFIYPQQKIASVNFVEFPANVPLDFEITSDSVMNSFWIPALGSQIYSMPGMMTQVHLMASRSGDFHGLSANISGQGFAGMGFTARAASMNDFNNWVGQLWGAPRQLNQAAYAKLIRPSQNNPASYYSRVSPDLFDSIVLKYMAPSAQNEALMNKIMAEGHMETD